MVDVLAIRSINAFRCGDDEDERDGGRNKQCILLAGEWPKKTIIGPNCVVLKCGLGFCARRMDREAICPGLV